MLFESQHSIKDNEFSFSYHKSKNFQTHIHRAFEYYEQVEGSTEVTVGKKKYLLSAGDAVLIFPLQPHSYTYVEAGRIRLCIFSPDMATDFYKKNENRRPLDNKFRCSLPENISVDTVFHKKALAYFICGEFERGREYAEEFDRNEDRLLVSVLHYADKNFCTECLLRDAASSIGYDYTYVSKIFKRRAGISFRQYVNNLRIMKAKQLLATNVSGMEQIAEECGFASLRAFDREFRAQMEMTPSEYRKAFGTI